MSIEKRPNGTYRVRWREADGRQRARHFTRKRDAELHLATVRTDTASGRYVDPTAGKAPLVVVMAEHIERQPGRANTRRNAQYALGRARAHFGVTRLSQVTTSDLQAFVTTLGRELEPRTVASIYRFVRQTLRAALIDGLIGRDPCLGVRMPRHEGGEVVVPTGEQVYAFHAVAPSGFSAAVVLGAGLGLRAGEAAGMTIDRIDFLRREVRVDRQWHGRDDRFEPVKSPASNRRVPASDEVLARLSASIAAHGAGEHGVILHVDGRPLNANRLGWRWEQTTKAAGVAAKFHDLRHHFASSLLSGGCSVVAVQRALGHSSAAVTLNTYGHLMPSDHDRIRAATATAWQSEDSVRTADAR